MFLLYFYGNLPKLQAYHSTIKEFPSVVGNMAILPLRTQYRGPAPSQMSNDNDIIDESLYYFKANVFFRTYEIKVMFLFCERNYLILL